MFDGLGTILTIGSLLAFVGLGFVGWKLVEFILWIASHLQWV
jgi:hypothetical protein